MGSFSLIVLLLGNLLLLLKPCSTLPLCTNSMGPFKPNTTLTFCTAYNTTSCCDSSEDSSLQKQFQAMNITDPDCATIMASILCAKCDPFSAELFRIGNSPPKIVPTLCNSTISANSTQAKQASNNFCAQVWGKCSNISVLNSPFVASLQDGQSSTSNSTKITEFWQSESTFCSVYGGASLDDSVCFDGTPVTFNSSTTLSFPSGMCLEKISNSSYNNMVAHPDGSSRAFFSTQQGQVWLANLPVQGSSAMMQVEANPFLDLSSLVLFDIELGLKSIAVHPNFAQNGRFFASYNCDKSKWDGCGGRCSCNSAANCDPSKLPADNGVQPCQYQSVITEFTANGTTSPNISSGQYESVDMVTKGGNYGWRVYNGPYLYIPPKSPGGNTSANSIREILPVMGFNFSSINKQEGTSGVIGGYFYRSTTDPCMYGSYVYADFYGAAFWAGIENPQDSGSFNQTLIPFTCASDSPIPCSFLVGVDANDNQTGYPALGDVWSLGEDNNNDIYLLSTSGVYRIVSPNRCNYTCSRKEVATPPSPSPTSTPSQTSCLSIHRNAMLLCSSLLLIFLDFI